MKNSTANRKVIANKIMKELKRVPKKYRNVGFVKPNDLLQELSDASEELSKYDDHVVQLKKEIKAYRRELQRLVPKGGEKTRKLLEKYK